MKEAGPTRLYLIVSDSIHIGSKPDKTKLTILKVRILFRAQRELLIFGLGVFTVIKLICALFCIMLCFERLKLKSE